LGAIGEGNAAFFRGGHIRLKVNIWATHGRNTTKVPGRLMLTVLASMAEFERRLIGIRTSEGRAPSPRAKSRPKAHPRHGASRASAARTISRLTT
jgi:DNA invertase Pin-like site-specific DNA recombinase